MFNMSASKSEAPKACRTLTTLRNPRVEVRLGLHGFCSRLSTYLEEERHDLDHRGLTHDGCSLHNYEKHMDLRPIGASLPREDSVIAWC